jgi:hypothetical protein
MDAHDRGPYPVHRSPITADGIAWRTPDVALAPARPADRCPRRTRPGLRDRHVRLRRRRGSPIPEGTEEACAVQVSGRSVTFEFLAEEVLGTGEGVEVGQTFTVDMLISTALDGELSEAGRQFLDRIQEVAPLGETFVLYGTNPDVESNQFVAPGGWAMIREDGTLVSMGPRSDPTSGIAGVTRLEELPPVE